MEQHVTEAESAALKEEACHLVDRLHDLFDQHSLVAVASALHAVIECDRVLSEMVSKLAFEAAIKRFTSSECSCPNCVAERAAKRGQA